MFFQNPYLYSNVFFPLMCICFLTSFMEKKYLPHLLAEESTFFFFFFCWVLNQNIICTPFKKIVSNYLRQGELPHIYLSKDLLLSIYFSDKTSKETKVQSIPLMLFILHGTTENL